jgi:hypothetical protein
MKMVAYLKLCGVKHYRDWQNISPDLPKRILQFGSKNVYFIKTYFLDENTDAQKWKFFSDMSVIQDIKVVFSTISGWKEVR